MPDLTLEGRVHVKSGRILIADQCYVAGFDMGPVQRVEDRLFGKRMALGEKKHRVRRSMGDTMEQLKLALDTRESLTAVTEQMQQAEEELERLDSEEAKLWTEPRFCPPYMMQGPRYALVANPIGDGTYPIVQLPRRLHMVYDVPLKRGRIDKERLEGKMLGTSAVDSGVQLIADARGREIKEGVHKKAYAVIGVKPGLYVCRFIEDNDTLSIRRI